MNEPSPAGHLFSFRSMFSPLSSPTNMQQSDEQTKTLPQPAPLIQNRLAPSYDPADKGFRRFHHHTISDSSAVGSNDSSPTTTISTVDDSSATEPSPGSSPESPPPNNFAVGMHRPRTAGDSPQFFELQKQPPPRKGRNLKNLAVNTSRNPGKGLSSASLPLPTANADNLTTDASLSFVKPPTPSKRKPSNLGLTLLTPNSGTTPLQEIRLAIPPTPAFSRPGTLRHFQSSPSLPLLSGIKSEDDPGGYPAHVGFGTTLETIMSPAQPDKDTFEEQEEECYDVPLSQEEKPEAYPDGPICVYEPYIDLYLEPTVEQAREYDVIMNVASEVRNPFGEQGAPEIEEPEIRIDGGGGIQYAPKRDRISQKRPEAETGHDASPTTPKATPLESSFSVDEITPRAQKEPEYIHIKWEHNSDIVPDLLRLVKLIDEKVMQDKRVLVHCQCGVSRSASLVVAYGLYKDPSLSVQEAYDAVKDRSKWIGPNMNLIMQLQEFRTSLMHGGLLASNRMMTPLTPGSALADWRGPFAASSTAPNTSQVVVIPSPAETGATECLPVVMSGPSSAPSTAGLPRASTEPVHGQRARAVSAVKPGTAYVSPSGQVVPMIPILKVVEPDAKDPTPSSLDSALSGRSRQESSSTTPTELAKSSSTEEEFALTPLQPSPDVDPADSFGLMSPTSTEFSSSPFDRAALLARLGMGSIGQQEDLAPRRSLSLRNRKSPKAENTPSLSAEPKSPKLRLKISSPDLRERQELQNLQARIEQSQRNGPISAMSFDDGGALMSPRATEFTQNPFSLPASTLASPTTPTTSSDSDPRSPAQKGVSPITRNILDVL